jgi:hypothetical protein
MIRPFVYALGFAFATAIVDMLAPAAQTEDVLDACELGKQEIEAAGFARRRAAWGVPDRRAPDG